MKLFEALKTISEECKKHNHCKDCPLRDAQYINICAIADSPRSPSSWDIKEGEYLFKTLNEWVWDFAVGCKDEN